ncbi:MAG: hypothetical protein IJ639_08520, partial [Ruminococcus sp.]|nr:hypothetical protein [Ruminococcus sp.]
ATVYNSAATYTTNSTSSGTTVGTNKAHFAGTTITVTGSPKSGKWAKVDVTYDTPAASTSAAAPQSLLSRIYELVTTGAGTTTDTYYIKSSAAGQNSVTFQMPASNATVNVTYTDPPTQTLTVSSGRNGSVAITGSSISGNSPKNVSAGTSNATMQAKAGDVLTITATPATGYSVDKIYINGVESNTTSYTVTTNASQTISVTFKVYETDADWYYVPVTDSGSSATHGTAARMTESQYNGQPFAYYHVTGRTEQSQLFYVKNETTTSGSSTGTRYVYLTTANNISSEWWNANPHVYFYNASGDVGSTWDNAPAMSYVKSQNNDSEKVWKYAIPSGATGVVFKSGTGVKQSVNADLTTTNGCYWFPNSTDGSGYFNLNQWDTPESDAGLSSSTTTTKEYFWYKNDAGSGEYQGSTNNNEQSEAFAYNATANRFGSDLILYGYYDGDGRYHYAHHNFGAANTEEGKDYYVIVYYPSTNYGEINGKNANNTMQYNPVIVCSTTLPNASNDTITVYAKDGCINEARGTTRTIGTTTISGDAAYVKNIARQMITGGDNNSQTQTITCYATAQATPGQEITITTEINSSYTNKYVVKGWDVNGTTYGIDPTATGNAYSMTFTVPENATKLEITPIYWLKNSGGTTIFYIRDFNTVPDGWGDALYYYFWGGSQVNVDAEERYPGQPVVHDGGQYYTQIPVDVTGITLNNAIWDTIHAEKIMGITENKSEAHYQTYDYDNFKKIITEKTNINSIYFTFEPETAKDNFESNHGSDPITISDFDDTNGNGWEDYKNVLGQDINIFGGIDVTNTSKTLYVVSNGYVRNYQGDYATEYSIYYSTNGTTGTKIGDIPGSALIMNDSNSFTKIVYNSSYGPALSTYLTTYNTLKANYANCPVKITYEQGIYAGNTRINTDGATPSGGTDMATRIDGKWDFTTADMMIDANIIIQKSDDNGNSWTEDTFSTGNTGTATGAQAYFNNTGAAYCNTHSATNVPISNTDTFKLKTVPDAGTGYVFVGWYRLDDNTDHAEPISTNTESESKMSSKATFIARYKKVSNGNLVINHLVDGAGTPNDYTVQVQLLDTNDSEVQTFGSSSSTSVTLDSTYIHSDSTDKIKVTLVAKAADGSYIANTNTVPTVTCSQDASTFYKMPTYDRNGRFAESNYPINVTTTIGVFNVSDLFNNTTQKFTVLNYTTTFNKLPTYTINYKYHGRQSTGASDYLTFTRTITLSADEAEGKNAEGNDYSGNNGTALRPTYTTTQGDGLVNDITANAPDQNDLETEVFNKNITWSVPASVDASPLTVYATETDPTYTLTYKYYTDAGVEQTKTVTGAYNTLIRFGETSGTVATASTKGGQKFAYWADANDKPLTNSILYSMRLIDNVTIHPVYGGTVNGWESAIDKITRTHETSDTSDNIFTDFALRFTGFDSNGAFIHINPDHLGDYKVGVAVVYDTAGDNTTETTEQINGSAFYDLTKSSKYGTKENLVQLLITNNKTSARLSEVSATTYVTRFDADNSKLTNLNRIDLAVKYNYKQNYKRKYDAYAYIVDTSNNTVIAVSPVKSGYLYDGTLPVGN